MDRVIGSNGGYIDNYTGDGLLAVFGAANSRKAPLRAVTAGIEMLEAVERLGPYLQPLYGRSLQIGVGVHYGEVVVGSFGPSDRRRDTVIGDAVNVASRIEGANKEVGTSLLISGTVYRQVKDHIRLGQKARIRLRGKSGEHDLYEVCALA